MFLDPYMSGEAYVEDCQVFCNPIEIEFEIVDDRVVKFEAIKLQ